MKLFEEKKHAAQEDFIPLLHAIFGVQGFEPALNEKPAFAAAVSDALMDLETGDIRFFRHPEQSKPLLPYIRNRNV